MVGLLDGPSCSVNVFLFFQSNLLVVVEKNPASSSVRLGEDGQIRVVQCCTVQYCTSQSRC